MSSLHRNESFAAIATGICLGIGLCVFIGPWASSQEALTEGGRLEVVGQYWRVGDNCNCLDGDPEGEEEVLSLITRKDFIYQSEETIYYNESISNNIDSAVRPTCLKSFIFRVLMTGKENPWKVYFGDAGSQTSGIWNFFDETEEDETAVMEREYINPTGSVTVDVYDLGGNVTHRVLEFKLDEAPPTITSCGTMLFTEVGGEYSLSVAANDLVENVLGSGVKRVELYINEVDEKNLLASKTEPTGGYYTFSFSPALLPLSAPNKQYIVRAIDNVGNISVCNLSASLTANVYGPEGSVHMGADPGSVACGDVNGDGYDDLILGVPGEDSDAGAVYVIYGATHCPAVARDLGDSQQYDVRFSGPSSSQLGKSVACGDVNGDSYDDIIMGAPEADSVYVYLGNKRLGEGNNQISLANDNTAITLTSNANDGAGSSVSTGDINADGLKDIIIGAPSYASISGEGRVYLVLGAYNMTDLADLPSANSIIQGMQIMG
jgi:hypothetical protein